MKTIITVISAAFLVSSFGLTADAAPKKKDAMAMQSKAQCQRQANAKYSTVHFLKRRNFVNECMGKKA